MAHINNKTNLAPNVFGTSRTAQSSWVGIVCIPTFETGVTLIYKPESFKSDSSQLKFKTVWAATWWTPFFTRFTGFLAIFELVEFCNSPYIQYNSPYIQYCNSHTYTNFMVVQINVSFKIQTNNLTVSVQK